MLTFPRKVEFYFVVNFNCIQQKFSMLLYRTQTQSINYNERCEKVFHMKRLSQI